MNSRSKLCARNLARLDGIAIAMEWESRDWCGYTGTVTLFSYEELEGFCLYLGAMEWAVPGPYGRPFSVQELCADFVQARKDIFQDGYDSTKQFIGVRHSLSKAFDKALGHAEFGRATFL